MKRFLVFSSYNYESSGGWKDILGDADTLEEAEDMGRAVLHHHDWWHVVDIQEQRVVSDSWYGRDIPDHEQHKIVDDVTS